jgi:hypothetical protein
MKTALRRTTRRTTFRMQRLGSPPLSQIIPPTWIIIRTRHPHLGKMMFLPTGESSELASRERFSSNCSTDTSLTL